MRLILTVGLPQSGKSTWARAQGLPIVNPDAIRLALHGQAFVPATEKLVWALAHYMAKALFLAGHDTVIVDATNVSAKRRQEWEQLKVEAKGVVYAMEVRYQLIDTSPQVCKERATLAGRTDLIPVIERMAQEWDLDRPVHWKEGF